MRTTTSASSSYRRLFFHLLSALLVLGATASCSSSQSAFQFRPAPSGQGQQSVVASTKPEVVLPDATPAATQLLKWPAQKLQNRPPTKARLRRLVRPVAALARVPATSAAQAVAKPRVAAPAKVRRAFAPQQPAEVGLGTTVLGVLGLIVLPLSLLGLLIWGGPVWLVLAGLSALAVLIAYLDPFG